MLGNKITRVSLEDLAKVARRNARVPKLKLAPVGRPKKYATKEAAAHGTRERQLRKNYDITHKEYDALLFSQHNSCAICLSTDPGGNRKHFAVDHDHVTDRIRGLLCMRCNLSVVPLLERASDELLEAGYMYLVKHKQT